MRKSHMKRLARALLFFLLLSNAHPFPLSHCSSNTGRLISLKQQNCFDSSFVLGINQNAYRIISYIPLYMTTNVNKYSLENIKTSSANNSLRQRKYQKRKREWIRHSVSYYSRVARKTDTLRRSPFSADPRHAANLNFARHQVKRGKHRAAETIYRRLVAELAAGRGSGDGSRSCDHEALAVSTLLLALHLQRKGDVKGTRSVFLNFFKRVAVGDCDGDSGRELRECSCSAKVLQAFALFEMKRGNRLKSLEIVTKAVELDNSLAPVLGWKQFRDAEMRLIMKHSDFLRGV